VPRGLPHGGGIRCVWKMSVYVYQTMFFGDIQWYTKSNYKHKLEEKGYLAKS